jgi:hypothetical protein
MGVLASTPFIGALENNFSHIFLEPFPPHVSHSDSNCPAPLHSLSQSAPATVLLRFSYCPNALHRFVPIQSSLAGLQTLIPPEFTPISPSCSSPPFATSRVSQDSIFRPGKPQRKTPLYPSSNTAPRPHRFARFSRK